MKDDSTLGRDVPSTQSEVDYVDLVALNSHALMPVALAKECLRSA